MVLETSASYSIRTAVECLGDQTQFLLDRSVAVRASCLNICQSCLNFLTDIDLIHQIIPRSRLWQLTNQLGSLLDAGFRRLGGWHGK